MKPFSLHRKKSISLVKRLVICCAVFTSGMVFGDGYQEASALLDKMSKALRESNYQGRFVYVTNEATNSFQLQHALIGGKEYERLVFLNRDKQEIVRVGHDLFCVHTGNYLLRHSEDISSNPFSDRVKPLKPGIEKYYELKVRDGGRIAGREAVKISFDSRDGNRFNHALWLDRSNFLLLKSEISDPMLGSLESFEYVQLEVGKDIPLSEFKHEGFIRHNAKHYHPVRQIGESVEKGLAGSGAENKSPWHIAWLPDGFYFSGASVEKLENGSEVNMLMYSDGIAAITVFVEPVGKAGAFSESSQSGALSAYSHGRKYGKQDYMITAVGEVQLSTLERITKALEQTSTSTGK